MISLTQHHLLFWISLKQTLYSDKSALIQRSIIQDPDGIEDKKIQNVRFAQNEFTDI